MPARVLPPPVGTLRVKLPGLRSAAIRHSPNTRARARFTVVSDALLANAARCASNNGFNPANSDQTLRRAALPSSMKASVSRKTAYTRPENNKDGRDSGQAREGRNGKS